MNNLLESQLKHCLGSNFTIPLQWQNCLALISQTFDNFEQELANERNNRLLVENHLASSQRIAKVGSWELELNNEGGLAVNKLYWSDETYRILGFIPGIDTPSYELFLSRVPAAYHETINRSIKEAAELHKPYNFEHHLLLPGGIEKIVHGRSSTILSDSGQTVKIIGTIQDITAVTQEEEEAKKILNQLHTLFENMQEAFFSVDMETYQMLQMSKASERVWGYPVSDFYKNPNLWFDVIVEEDKPVVIANYTTMQAGWPFIQEYRIMHGNGSVRWLQSTISPTLGAEGKLIRIDGMTMDITARKTAEKAIADSEKRYRILFEQNLAGIYRTNPAGQILNCNQAFASMLGYTSPAELENVNAKELYFTDAERAAFIHQLQTKRKLSNNDFALKRRDGNPLYVIENVSLATNPETGEEFCDGIMIDITERKKAEAELHQSEKRFRQIVETAQEGIWTIDEYEKTNFVNSKMCEILGYTAAEMLGRELYDFMDEEGKAYAIACMERRRNGAKENLDIRYVTKAGRDVWANISANPIIDENGKYIGSLAMVTDITDRREQHQLLQKSEANLKTIFNNTESCYVLMDATFTIVSFNTVAYNTVKDLCGLALKEGNAMPGCFFPQGGVPESVKEILTVQLVRYETLLTRLDGQAKWFAVKWVRVIYEDKGTSGIILSCKDITDRKIIALEHERITADLVQRNKHLQQFNYIVSHNLRAPVANIMGLIKVFTDAGSETRRDELLPALSNSVNSLDNIIRDLTKILASREHVHEKMEIVYFKELVETITGSIARIIQKEDVLVQCNFTAAPYTFSIRSYIYSIFYNLIINSIKYHKPGIPPQIIISSHQTNEHLTVTFKDNGKGIDLQRHLKDMFGLYKRFDKKVEGKGIGLFMVKTQVEELGGTITCESEVNTGTTFYVTLPLRKVE